MQFQCDPHRDFNPDWVDALSERQKKLLRMEKGLRIGNESDNAIYKS